MPATEKFRKASSELNSTSQEFYDRSFGTVFEKEETNVKIEARCWSTFNLGGYGKDEPTPLQCVSTKSPTVSHSEVSSVAREAACELHSHIDTNTDIDQTAGQRTQSSAGCTRGLQSLPSNPTAALSQLSIIDLDIAKLSHFIRVSSVSALEKER